MSSYANFLGPEGFGCYEVDWTQGPPTRRVDAQPAYTLVPGFVDIHIHGAFGIDFMDASSTELLSLCERLAGQGYEAFLPTTITAPVDEVLRAISHLPDHPMIAGFHLEGPFISPKYPGAQPLDHIAGFDAAGWSQVFEHPLLRIVTLAAELPGSSDLVKKQSSRGVIVSLGHTDGTYAQCEGAKSAGARHITHTFNAMRPLHHREPGAVGFALACDDIACELIYDRIHVSKEAAAILVNAKQPDKLIAVSDSSRATGLPDGAELSMWGHECIVRDGSVRIKASGALAGSTITLLDAFRNLAGDFGPEIAIRACSFNPRNALDLQLPRVFLEMNRHWEIADMRSLS